MNNHVPKTIPIPEWSPHPDPNVGGVVGKVLLRTDNVVLSILRFENQASIHEHAGATEADVICLEGDGFVSVDGETSEFTAGQSIRWPAGLLHKLWTEDQTMQTLMVEHHESVSDDQPAR